MSISKGIGRGNHVRTPEMRANYSRSAQNRKYTEEGLRKIKERAVKAGFIRRGIPLSAETRIKIGLAQKGKPRNSTGNLGHFHSKEVRERISAGCKLSYQNNPDRYKKAKIAGLKGIQSQDGLKPTKIELLLYSALDKMNAKYEKQYIVGGEFIVDAFVPSHNLIIEADGEYWHSLPRAIRNDWKKDTRLSNEGYKILRIKERDFKNNNYLTILEGAL